MNPRKLVRHAPATAAALVAGATLAVVSTQTPTATVTTSPVPVLRQEPDANASTAQGCGTERADVKHLTDGFTLPGPTVMTPDQLVGMQAPPVVWNSPRLAEETKLVELRNVHVIAAKQEPDSDLHVIITTPTGAEMNVESPMAICDATSRYAPELATARAALDTALGSVSSSSYTPVDLHATIRGVLFFDVLHGQRGAPNGVELHPVTYFSTGSGPAPPPQPVPPPGPPPPGPVAPPPPPHHPPPPPPPPAARDADYKADPAECKARQRSDSDASDDAREGC